MNLKLKKERPLQHEYWMLPRVPFKVKVWLRIPRISKYIPFGYEVDPEDNDWLKPIPEELELLELAKKTRKTIQLEASVSMVNYTVRQKYITRWFKEAFRC